MHNLHALINLPKYLWLQLMHVLPEILRGLNKIVEDLGLNNEVSILIKCFLHFVSEHIGLHSASALMLGVLEYLLLDELK
jgi:hypothetical protein